MVPCVEIPRFPAASIAAVLLPYHLSVTSCFNIPKPLSAPPTLRYEDFIFLPWLPEKTAPVAWVTHGATPYLFETKPQDDAFELHSKQPLELISP